MTSSDSTESKISSFFDHESQGMRDQHEDDGIPQSMQYQIDDIITEDANIVLDVGSGPGSFILKLLDSGIEKAIGLDLSEKMNKIAQERLKVNKFDDRAVFYSGNYLTTEIEEQPDAISLHRVLCCHPNRESMLQKSVSYQPKIITLTVPRDWKILRLLVGIVGFLAKVTNSFRPYIHTQKKIDEQMELLGYQKGKSRKDWWWVTTTYYRKQ